MIAQDSNEPTGIAADTDGGNVVRARDRKANAALQLRTTGASWEDIAEVIGFPTARAALIAVERALEKELRTESKDALRQLAARRLDRMLRSVWPKAINSDHPEHLAAVGRGRELIADYRRLHGLDAPTEISVHSPTAQELESWVADVVGISRPQLEEADLFEIGEGDIVEGSIVEEDDA